MPRTRYEYTSTASGTYVAPSRAGVLSGGNCWTQARLAASVEKQAHDVYRRPAHVGSEPPKPWEYVGTAFPNSGVYKAKAGDGKALQALRKLQEEVNLYPSGSSKLQDRGYEEGIEFAIETVRRVFGIG